MRFDSNVTVAALINDVKSTMVISDIPDDSIFYSSLNTFLWQLYSGVINDIVKVTLQKNGEGTFALPSESEQYARVRQSDVKKVYADGYEYTRVDADCPPILREQGQHIYSFDDSSNIVLLGEGADADAIEVCFAALPLPYSSDDTERALCVPEEFVILCKAKLISEAYRMCDEDALCANWTEEYNSILSSFRIWLEVNGQ